MQYRYVLPLMVLPLSLYGQATVRGLVTEQNSGNRPLPGVQIKALGSAPEATDNAGAFRLTFAAKKPGERIVVSEISKQGYEIVNKDAIANWLIPADPQARTKIVLCPEGTLARNMARYYDISLAALTRGYNEQLRRLQAQRDSARIDAAAYGAQAEALADQYTKQQLRLEELAERFSRDNFDDCTTTHRQAFESFQRGDIDGAIRILESVNSDAEIAKAKAQREKGMRMLTAGSEMLSESDSVIRRNIDKLLFQAGLYVASGRFADAARTFASAAQADTAYFKGVSAFAGFLNDQAESMQALRWAATARIAARSASDSAAALREAARAHRAVELYPQAERELDTALSIQRRLTAENPQAFRPELADLLTELGSLQVITRQNARCDSTVREALAIQRELLRSDPVKYTKAAVFSLTLLGRVQCDMDRCDNGEVLFLEALSMYRNGPTPNAPCEEFGALLNGMALLQRRKGAMTEAQRYANEALAVARQMAAANPDANATHYANTLHNTAVFQRGMGQLDSAIANELLAIAIVEQRMEKNPRHYTDLLVSFLRSLSYHYYDRKHWAEAAHTAKRSLAMVRVMAEDDPASHSGELLEQLYAVASALWNDGQYDSADVYYLESLDRARKLAVSDSANFRYTLPIALSLVAYDTYRERLQRSIALALEALPLFRRLAAEEPGLREPYAMCCTRLSRYLILSRRFGEAEDAVQEAVAITGTPRWLVKNLAHSLLYQGKYELAKPFYEELRGMVAKDGTVIRDVMLADFDEFEKAGITHPDVARVRALITAAQETPK